MDIESDSPTSLSLQPSLDSLESNGSGDSSPYSPPWSPDSQPRWPDVQPWSPESEASPSDVQAQSPVSQSWSPYLRVVPKVLLVSPEPPPISRKVVICSYSPTERIYSDDSLDSELPWGDVVPDTLDSEGGYIDYCVPESITTDSISHCDGIDEAYLKALGHFCPSVLKLLDKVKKTLLSATCESVLKDESTAVSNSSTFLATVSTCNDCMALKNPKSRTLVSVGHNALIAESIDFVSNVPTGLFLLFLFAGTLLMKGNMPIFPSNISCPSLAYIGLATAQRNVTFVMNLLLLHDLYGSASSGLRIRLANSKYTSNPSYCSPL
ncbi:hypothetical protein OROHE_006927 [Orobanche hederae]